MDSPPEVLKRYRLERVATVRQDAMHIGVELTTVANMRPDKDGDWVKWADVGHVKECPKCERLRQWMIELIKEKKFDKDGNPA